MATPARGALQQLLERAHSPDTAGQIFTEKIQHREQFLRPTSPGREERVGDGNGASTTATTSAAASLAAAAAANTAAELAAAGASGHNGRDARRRARRIKQEQRQHRAHALKPKPLSSRQRRAIEKPEADSQKQAQPKQKPTYATFIPLHRLWLGYIREVLGPQELRTGGAGAAAKLTAADFHGALVEVTRSACVGRVGTRGIVVRDTRFVFEVVTPANEVKMVPKEGSFFRIEIPVEDNESGVTEDTKDEPTTAHPEDTPKLVIEILGSQFMHRAADRAGRKFKQHFYKEL